MKTLCFHTRVVASERKERKKILKQGSISPTKTLFCGNTFNDVVTLGAPRRGKNAILIRLQSVFKLVSGLFM